MTRRARERYAPARAAHVVYDGQVFPFASGQFDLIYSVATIQHIQKDAAYLLLRELHRALAPGGHAVLHFLSVHAIPASEVPFELECQYHLANTETHWHFYYSFDELFTLCAEWLGVSDLDIRLEDNSFWVHFSKDTGRAFLRPELPDLTHPALLHALRRQAVLGGASSAWVGDSATGRLADELLQRNDDLLQARTQLRLMENSAGWKMLQRLRRSAMWLLPNHTPLGRLNRLARRAMNIWLDGGPRALAARAAARLGLGRNGARPPASAPARAAGPERILALLDELDLGRRPAVVHGALAIQGWALAESGVERIEAHLGGQLAAQAELGRFRPDVAMAYPAFADASRAGFRVEIDTTTLADGLHDLRLRVVSRQGHELALAGRVRVDNRTPRQHPYQAWIARRETQIIEEARQSVAQLAYRPLLSLVMPVYNTDARLLGLAYESLKAQIYDNWELCICDDGSTDPATVQTLQALAQAEPRLRLQRLEANGGITAASNAALALAQGEFITLMDSDDALPPHALYEVVKLLNAQPAADLIYSDEDKIDEQGRRYEPFFKPDWSPDLFLSCNYVAHLTTIRAALARAAGGFVAGFEGSQDYDLYLRVVERAREIHHIPAVLYHWRASPTSTASSPGVRLHAHEAARRAIQAHLERQQAAATVVPGNTLGRWRVQYALPAPPPVAVLLPTGGNVALLSQCLTGLAEKTDYPDLEVIVIDNSRRDAVQARLAAETRLRVRCLDQRNQPFNYSVLNNLAAREAQAPLLLFLNDDIEPLNADWLRAMVEHAQRPSVGAVGAKLIYPNGTLQHAGVVLGLYANSGHAFKHLPADEGQPLYFDLPHVIRNVSAVTAACLLARREVFWEAGGFEPVHLAVAFQDVDLCLKLRARGYDIVYTPHARLLHHEAVTKAEKIPNPYEVQYMQRQWAKVIARDPFYNPNLTRLREDFSLDPAV
jgi:GT2 family glycosyltransferase